MAWYWVILVAVVSCMIGMYLMTRIIGWLMCSAGPWFK